MSLIDARELLKMAIRDEETGMEFYQVLADKTEDEALRKKFLEIREQEIGHAERFREMVEGLGDYVPREEVPGDYEHYYESFLSKRDYMNPDDAVELARKTKTDEEAIRFALSQEKDTLLFFIEMKELVPSNQHRDLVQAVIHEERTHVIDLSQLLLDRC